MTEFKANTTVGNRRGVTAINLDDLAPALVPLTDPNIETQSHGQASRPAVANPTSGPHRYTIVVPNTGGNAEGSVVNIGQAAANRINDTGITGRTKSHIHWHTTEQASMTMLSLGIHTNEGFVGLDGTNWLAQNTGFMMTTNADSFLDAEKQMYIASRNDNLILHAQTGKVRVIADKGGEGANIELTAANDVLIGGIHNVVVVADPNSSLVPTAYKKKLDEVWPATTTGTGTKEVMTVLDLMGTAQGLFSAFKTQNAISNENFKSGWINDLNGTAKFWVDIAKAISTVGRYLNKKAPGQVKIYADSYAGLSGSTAASMYGGLSASVTSPLSASMLGGTASVKGLAWTSVWAGMGASLKTLWGKADLKSEYGKTNVGAKLDVAIASKEGGGTFTAKTKMQVNATDGPAAIHSDRRTYLGAGKGGGYGLLADTEMVKIGELSSAASFGEVNVKDDLNMKLGNGEILATCKDSTVHLGSNVVRIESKEIMLDSHSGDVTVKGKKVLLG